MTEPKPPKELRAAQKSLTEKLGGVNVAVGRMDGWTLLVFSDDPHLEAPTTWEGYAVVRRGVPKAWSV
jgi:hypothetical protein